MEENNLPESKPSNNPAIIAGAIVLAGVMVAGAILLKDNAPETATPGAPDVEFRPISRDEHIRGNPNARVILVEYSDLECPFCKAFHATAQRVIEEREEVAWVYRHYPIPQLHQKAIREAQASECASEQGGNDAFWRYVDRIFEITPSNDGLEDRALAETARYIGLDLDAFNACLASGKYREKVEADVEDGNRIGVRGTPSSFILKNGKVVDTIPGALPFETVMGKIDQALK